MTQANYVALNVEGDRHNFVEHDSEGRARLVIYPEYR